MYRLKEDFPALEICINGGIQTLEQAGQHLREVDGVMIGREAYRNPWLLSRADPLLFAAPAPGRSRRQIVELLLPFVEAELSEGTPLPRITRHILGLFQGQPGARAWRRCLSEQAHRDGAGPELIRRAAELVQETR